LVITSAQNEHKKDNDKEDSRRLLSKIVTTEDHLAKVDIQLQWQAIQLFRDMKLHIHMFRQVPEMESMRKEQAGNVLSPNPSGRIRTEKESKLMLWVRQIIASNTSLDQNSIRKDR